ncbi:MAG: shikimate kinase [Christensenellales bacterium]
MSKTNLCIVGLSKQFTDDIGKQLSIRLDMFYANIQEILEFELMDIEKMGEVCGVDYLLKEEKSIIRRVCSYDNTLINIEYSTLNIENNLDIVKNNCLIIYLKLNERRFQKEQTRENINNNVKNINKDLFHDRDFICNKLADIIVDCDDYKDNDLIDIIIEKILKYYTK